MSRNISTWRIVISSRYLYWWDFEYATFVKRDPDGEPVLSYIISLLFTVISLLGGWYSEGLHCVRLGGIHIETLKSPGAPKKFPSKKFFLAQIKRPSRPAYLRPSNIIPSAPYSFLYSGEVFGEDEAGGSWTRVCWKLCWSEFCRHTNTRSSGRIYHIFPFIAVHKQLRNVLFG